MQSTPRSQPETRRRAASQFYGDELCNGIEAMRKLVYAFYDTSFSFGRVLKKHPELKGDLTDCLIGNLSKDFGPLFDAVSEFADVPKPLPYGKVASPSPVAVEA